MAQPRILLLFALLILFFVSPPICEATPEGRWELVDTKSGKAIHRKEQCNEHYFTPSEGSFNYRTRYFQGVCNQRNEETFSTQSTWTPPPTRLNPGEVKQFTITATRGSNIPRLFLSNGISVSIDKPGCLCGGVCGGYELGRAVASSRIASDTDQKVVQFKVPDGSKNGSFALRFCPVGWGFKEGFRYIYEWVDGAKVTTKATPKSGVPLKWKNPSEYEVRQKIILTVGPGSSCILEKNGGDIFVLNEGDRAILDIQDIIKTPNRVGSRCQINYPDGSLFKIKYKSEVTLVSGGLKLKFGETWFNLRKLGRQGFRVVTPNTTTGCRGTSGLISVSDDGATTVRLFEGKVSVTNQKGLGGIVLAPGYMTICKIGNTPTPPAAFDRHSLQPWWEDQGQTGKSGLNRQNLVRDSEDTKPERFSGGATSIETPSKRQTSDEGGWQPIGK